MNVPTVIDTDAHTCRMPGLGDLPLLQPGSVAELGEMVRATAGNGKAIYPIGGGTMLDLGLPPTKRGIAIVTTSLAQVIDYPARDMTITVQAGITVARLQEILRQENQRLPIDVPLSDRATLGGAVACNVSGSRRYGFGTLRDYVIGISVVNDRGQEVKAGGRVVKNVAGYDLCKLYTGSLGTLGIITQLTLKVRPVPERGVLICLNCSADNLEILLGQLHAWPIRPVCVDLLSPAAVREVLATAGADQSTDWMVLVGFEDNEQSVAWQVEQLKQELAASDAGGWLEWEGAGADQLWAALADYPLTASSSLSFKANLLPRGVADFCRLAESLAPKLQTHAGNGLVVGHFPDGLRQEQAAEMVQRLRERAVAAQGNLILPRCPAEWKAALGLWGEARGDWEMMRKVRQQLDPRTLFNPGRFIGEI